MAIPRTGVLNTALLLLIFLLPSSFQVTPPAIPIGDFYITLVEICIFILLGHWILELLSSGKGYRSSLDGYYLLFISYLCLSLLIGFSHFGGKMAFADFRNYLPLFLYFWAMRFFGLAPDLSRVRQLIYNVMIVVAAYILFLFLFFRDILATSDKMAERVLFDNTIFLLMCYGGYMVGKLVINNNKRAFMFANLALNGLMLLVMQVRSYWVAFVFVIGASVLQQRRSVLRTSIVVKTTFLFVASVFTITLLISIVPTELTGLSGAVSSMRERVASLVNIEQTLFGWESHGSSSDTETIGTRVMSTQVVWNNYFLKNPFFGTGFGGELPMVSRLGGIVQMKYSVDNGYLTILAKFGVIGFALYGLIIWRLCILLYHISKSLYANDDERLLARSFLTGLFAILIASFFSSISVRQQPSLIAFLFMVAETEVMRRNVEARRRNLQQ